MKSSCINGAPRESRRKQKLTEDETSTRVKSQELSILTDTCSYISELF